MTSRSTLVRCCYLGMFVQAMVINITPLLFIPLQRQFGLSFEQIGRLILINFLTQMIVDLICTALADRVNPKPLVTGANFLAAAGLWLFGGAAFWFQEPYTGLIAGTVVFSIGCGLLEVLLSPIINAIPSDRKSADMAMLHAFYPIGKVAVIVVTGVALHLAGDASWPFILAAWSLVPLLNTLAFLFVRIPELSPAGRRQPLRSMFSRSAIFLLLIAMVLAGATEVTIAQWTSAFVEQGLGYSKFVADLLGFGLFGVGMIVGRVWFGRHGEQGNLSRVMHWSALLSASMCAIMALSPLPAIALAACAASGLFVSMLWPGTISLSAAQFPFAGASLFALLAAAGDAGAGLMPWLVGWIADHASSWIPGTWLTSQPRMADPQSLGLRVAFLITALCPLLMIPVNAALKRSQRGLIPARDSSAEPPPPES